MNWIERSRKHSLGTSASAVVERLEERRLLANQFVGEQFDLGGDVRDAAPQPTGYAVVRSSGAAGHYLDRRDFAGQLIGTPTAIHPGEPIRRFDRVSTDATGNIVVAWIADLGINKTPASYKLFDKLGQPRTPMMRVDSNSVLSNAYYINTDMLEDGRFLVSWIWATNNT